jgi:hypothetical protein
MNEPTSIGYGTLLRITWLLAWRGTLINLVLGVAVGAPIGIIFALAGAPIRDWLQPVAVTAGTLIAVFVGGPLLVRMMLRKRFRGFRLLISREP